MVDQQEKHNISNICTSTILWSLWNVRNAMCFQGLVWSDVKMELFKTTGMMQRGAVLCKGSSAL